MQRHLVAGGLFSALVIATLASCGARTSLLVPDPCRTEGATRACGDACGAGLSLCQDGFWSKCEVPEISRSCQNPCGGGQESCRDGAWGSCEVPVALRACADACGAGQDSCINGAWQGCVVPELQRPCESVCGPGNETCRKGAWGRCDAPLPKPPKLKSTIRDFSPTTHPDFELDGGVGLDLGIVSSALGADNKPIYADVGRTKSTTGRENFDKWYRDDPVNQSAPLDLQLQPSAEDAGLFVYDNHDFFPIDDQLLGNEGRAHNFHFTLEASTSFQYIGGEVFSFSGDDDMWVFINRQLAIDLGGLHASLSDEVALDDIAGTVGLQKGQVYPLHFFFAERHTIESNFTIRTSIAEPGSCD